MEKKKFSNEQILNILESILNKTLGEIDTKNVFDRTIDNPKITGIAGDVIEQSVLGMPGDNKQEADIIIDDKEFEVKTTGLRVSKYNILIAKEPMSITAVSPHRIISEDFFTSKFWVKIEHLLLIYYLYDSATTVTASDYRHFPIKGYQFLSLSTDDVSTLKNDWEIVRDFIQYLYENYETPEDEFSRISSEIRKQLMLIDTAPKWPNRPRFRFKRSFLSTIVSKHFGSSLTQDPLTINSYNDLDNICLELVTLHKDKTIGYLMNEFGIQRKKVDKSIAESIVVKMFKSSSSKINDIEIFKKSGVYGKSIVITKKGLRTEDMKLFRINFEELINKDLEFEESSFYDYFANNQLLCILFQEPDENSELIDNKFVGFKRVHFDDVFINKYVKSTWNQIRQLIFQDKLKEVVSYNKYGKPIINKTGVIKSAPNFPKAKNNSIFVRGTGSNSSHKTEEVNSITMYPQYIWIKGSIIINKIFKQDK